MVLTKIAIFDWTSALPNVDQINVIIALPNVVVNTNTTTNNNNNNNNNNYNLATKFHLRDIPAEIYN